jgi:hypothetical protein
VAKSTRGIFANKVCQWKEAFDLLGTFSILVGKLGTLFILVFYFGLANRNLFIVVLSMLGTYFV